MNKSVECHGNELSQILAAIRDGGGMVESIDTSVHGLPAQYRINYFERVTEESQSVPGSNRNAGQAGPAALATKPTP